jgi:hypothetical protein
VLARGRVEGILISGAHCSEAIAHAKGLTNFFKNFCPCREKKNKERQALTSFGSLVLVFQGHHGLLLHGSKKCTSICPNFIVYMCESSTLGQSMWDKTMVLLGTHWELVKTLWEHDGNNQNKIKMGPLECVFSLLIGCMKIMVLKLLLTIFNLSNIPLPDNVGMHMNGP